VSRLDGGHLKAKIVRAVIPARKQESRRKDSNFAESMMSV